MNAASGMIRTMAASPRVHLCNPKENAAEISALLDCADELGAQLCVFPELCLTGCSCGDLFYQESLLRGAEEALATVLEATRPLEVVTAVGLPLRKDNKLYNCAETTTKRTNIFFFI